MFSNKITSGLIFPITENGKTEHYVTDAPLEVVSPAFLEADCTQNFLSLIEEDGYRINKYSSGVELNFDKK